MGAPVRACQARVTAVRALAPEILEADLRMEEPEALAFEAGQWISVPFGPKRVRAYSIASTPRSSRVLTLCADVAPGGIGSQWFRALRPGDRVEFKGPLGGFVVSRADPRRPLFVAEEIGIVPIRAILADLDETGFGGPATLVYWARDPGWLAYDAELAALGRRRPGFAYHPVVRAAPPAWAGGRGEVADHVDRLVTSVEGLVAYVAGGAATIQRVREVLMAKGLERKAVKWEKFW
jgi:NAD(P)H-flavin reductase